MKLRAAMKSECSGEPEDYHAMTARFRKPSLRHAAWPSAPRQGTGRHAVQQTG
jgi:hypothetical protein